MTRRPLLAALLVLLTGCAGPDLSKAAPSPRATVPATEGLPSVTPPVTQVDDPAFTPEKLRVVDPCALIDAGTLKRYGTPTTSRLRDFSSCANYMRDTRGAEFNVTISVGEVLTVPGEPAATVAGLPMAVSELDDKSACFAAAVTDADPVRGITVQVSSDSGASRCPDAESLLETVVTRVRDRPPLFDLAENSLVAVEPCTLLPDRLLADALGGTVVRQPSGPHSCAWNAPGVVLSVAFEVGGRPESQSTSNGTKTVELLPDFDAELKDESTSGRRCRLQWSHTGFKPDPSRVEFVEVDLSRHSGEVDVCQAVQKIAKSLAPELPKR